MDGWHTPEIIKTAAAGLTGLAAALAIWQRGRVWHAIKFVWKKTFGRAHQRIEKNMTVMQAMLSDIAKEVRPNGRGSIQKQLAEIHDEVSETSDIQYAKMQADHIPTFRTDADGKVVFTNLAYQRLVGYNGEQLKGEGWIRVVQASDRDRVQDMWHRVVREKREINITLNCVKPDGAGHKMDVEVHRIHRRGTGELRGYYGVVMQDTCISACQRLSRDTV